MGWLIVQKGTSVGREFRLHEITTIGRRGDNDIVLDDATVSRSHAKIRLQDDTFVIADMGAANPTKVNGQEIGRQPLRDGDEVEIGKTQLVFKQIQSK
jgi:pSer/pThr/pTyr-binding forkhead associated (FHA) protein